MNWFGKLISNEDVNSGIYGWLPVNIFDWSDLEECLDQDLLHKRIEHYKFVNKRYFDEMKKYIEWNDVEFGIYLTEFKQYLEEKEKNIPDFIRRGLEHDSFRIRRQLIWMIKNIPEENKWEILELIKTGLEDSDSDVSNKARSMVQYLPEEDKKHIPIFIRKDFEKDQFWWIKIEALDMIKYVPEEQKEEILDLLKIGLENGDSDIRVKARDMIKHFAERDKKDIFHFFLKDIAELIEEGLKDHDIEVRKKARDMTEHISKKDKHELEKILLQLIKKEIEFPDHYGVEENATEMIQYVFEEGEVVVEKQLIDLINKNISDSNLGELKIYVHMMQYISVKEQLILKERITDLVTKKIDDPNVTVRNNAIAMINYVSEEKVIELRKQVPELINKWLQHEDFLNRYNAIGVLEFMIKQETTELRKRRPKLFIQGLLDPDSDINWVIKNMFENLSEPDKQFLYGHFKKELKFLDLSMSKWSHALYNYKDSKSNSKESNTWWIILTDKYVWKAYQRIILNRAFVCWKEAWEAHTFWNEEWFDYVPIEPIISFKFEWEPSNWKTKVVSKLLHFSVDELQKWNSYEYRRWYSWIEEEKEKILSWLKRLGISHWDIHDGNFCVQFFYTQDWRIDIEKCPRVYLIDWDRASFK